ncbi:MAG: DUF2071 domain-containing protein [Opitutaceae bacterium]|nr:DUF2071 domain-containing protein [Opitutaceae bacterium]
MPPAIHDLRSATPSLDARGWRSGFGAGPVTPLFVAHWKRVVFVHFAVRPADLAPHVPHALDVVDGRAFVSLVSFTLEGLRPGTLIPERVGRALLAPVSEHAFLNLRTYVRGPAGPGIHFLAEWINNPISLHLGPLTFGLPYHLAEIERVDLPAGGLSQIHVTAPGPGATIGITVPLVRDEDAVPCRDGSLDAFLVERYTAYTHRRGVDRHFHIAHRPWDVAHVDLVRTDTPLIEAMYPWFRHAELVGAHVGPGVDEVMIGRPHRCREASATAARAEPLVAGSPRVL